MLEIDEEQITKINELKQQMRDKQIEIDNLIQEIKDAKIEQKTERIDLGWKINNLTFGLETLRLQKVKLDNDYIDLTAITPYTPPMKKKLCSVDKNNHYEVGQILDTLPEN